MNISHLWTLQTETVNQIVNLSSYSDIPDALSFLWRLFRLRWRLRCWLRIGTWSDDDWGRALGIHAIIDCSRHSRRSGHRVHVLVCRRELLRRWLAWDWLSTTKQGLFHFPLALFLDLLLLFNLFRSLLLGGFLDHALDGLLSILFNRSLLAWLWLVGVGITRRGAPWWISWTSIFRHSISHATCSIASAAATTTISSAAAIILGATSFLILCRLGHFIDLSGSFVVILSDFALKLGIYLV